MIAANNGLLPKPGKKNVLQQSNSNFDASNDREDDYKVLEKNLFMTKPKDDMSFETENMCNSKTEVDLNKKSDAKKLRNVRLDLSSLKRGAADKANGFVKSTPTEFSSDESSEDEVRKKRKLRPVLPNYVTNTESGPCRKPRQSRQNPLVVSSQTSPKLAKSQPLSIARRNARERNRVKQVNEGFATLRSRIPEYISEAYNEEKGRKSAKKLSKVETLRMAVDYIRHLETLLNLRSNEKNVWIKQIKVENQPWSPPDSSVDCPSPVEAKYQPMRMESPGTSYDHTFEYQDRIFYDYDYDFASEKENPSPEKKPMGILGLSVHDSENQYVENFEYYETFNRLKKERNDIVPNENDVGEQDNLENVDILPREPETQLPPKPTNVIKKVPKKTTILPSITESFNKSKGIAVFF